MRASGWVLPLAAGAIGIVSVFVPLAALIGEMVQPEVEGGGGAVAIQSAGSLLATTSAWAAAIALGAMLIGWAPGRLLGAMLHRRGFVPLATVMLVPICLPAYIVFYGWWQMWPPDSALGAWIIDHELSERARELTLLVGMVCWSWPLVAWCVAGSSAARAAQREELLRVDGAGRARRLLDGLRTDAPGLALGGLVVFLASFNNTTCFNVANVRTFGYELQAVSQPGIAAGELGRLAAPSFVPLIAGVIVVWLLLASRSDRAPRRAPRVSRTAAVLTGAILAVSALFPLGALAMRVGQVRLIEEFIRFYGDALVDTLALAGACGLLAGVLVIGISAYWQSRRAVVRIVGHGLALGWLIAALLPGTLVAVAFESAYNRPGLDWLYTAPAILMLGYLARFGFIGVLLGRWLAVREPPDLRDLRLNDGADTLTGMWRTSWPRLLAGAGAAMAVVTVLSVGEVPLTARLQPVGVEPLARITLDAVHRQQPETVLVSALVMMLLAIVAALAAVILWRAATRRQIRSRAISAALALCAGVLMVGCGGVDDADRLDTIHTFGAPGRSPGQFAYPRAIAVDRNNGYVYVVDKTARVQRFDLDGEVQSGWQMPAWDMGKPVGLNVSPDGRVFVADTHYHRVIAYDAEGTELMRFGSYGQGPGQFIYPTDVEFDDAGRIYVSEYGGNDRVQVFTARGEYLYEFGEHGSGLTAFDRPQSMTFDRSGEELFIADSCNHRIVVTDRHGTVRRTLGSPGDGPGELQYPYDLTVLADGSLLVVEFGNNRVQRLSPDDGECLGLYGSYGFGPGELQYPWGIDGTDDTMYVLDSGNNRVQVISTPP